jgi:hypothetical protein
MADGPGARRAKTESTAKPSGMFRGSGSRGAKRPPRGAGSGPDRTSLLHGRVSLGQSAADNVRLGTNQGTVVRNAGISRRGRTVRQRQEPQSRVARRPPARERPARRSGAPVGVDEADDVVLAGMGAGLHFDDVQREKKTSLRRKELVRHGVAVAANTRSISVTANGWPLSAR